MGSRMYSSCMFLLLLLSSFFVFSLGEERITQGRTAKPNSWPWLVMLRATYGGLCGGVLIDTRHVLTAAHCFKPQTVPSQYKARVGSHFLSQGIANEQEIETERIWIHERYNGVTKENDIAIIRLAEPVRISSKINIISLPGSEANLAGEEVWIAGWGTTSFEGNVSPTLQEAPIKIVRNRCEQIFSSYNNQKQMCAGGDEDGRDTCQGDSGGPLMYKYNRQWYLNGIVSYGHGCGQPGYPGVYTRVRYYLPWILSKLRTP